MNPFEHEVLCDKALEYVHEVEDGYLRDLWRNRILFFLLGVLFTLLVGCAPTTSYLLTPNIDDVITNLDKEYNEPTKELTSFRTESGEVVTIEKLKYHTSEGTIVVYVIDGEVTMIYTVRDGR